MRPVHRLYPAYVGTASIWQICLRCLFYKDGKLADRIGINYLAFRSTGLTISICGMPSSSYGSPKA